MSVEIRGSVEEIVFRNDENGFVIAVVESGDEFIYVKGYIPIIHEGEDMLFRGRFVMHPTYGEQLEVTSSEILMPTDLEAIEKYLASGIIKGIGPATASRIMDHFGKNSLDIIQYDPARLTEVSGIGQKKADEIASAFFEQRALKDIMLFLQKYGVSVNYAMRIFKLYGHETIDIVSENPYQLADDVPGIGFRMADQIAKKMGVESVSPYRIATGIKYVLSQHVMQGHTYALKDDLIRRTADVLFVSADQVEDIVTDMVIRGSLHIERFKEESFIYPTPLYFAELKVCQKLVQLATGATQIPGLDLDADIKAYEAREEITLAQNQREAIKSAVQNGLMVITGGPGTGKTTIVNGILDVFERKHLKVLLAAPTGRAAKRLSEATKQEAKTIHRLLEYAYSEGNETAGFMKNEEDPLTCDAVVIDETSMVDTLLMNHLLSAIAPGTRVIFAGDVDQLPSVGPGCVLKDIIDSGVIPVVRLTEIFRQSEESMIVVNAHKINHGEMPVLNTKNKDFFFIDSRRQESMASTISQLVKKRLPEYYKLDPVHDIQVLTPTKKGPTGTLQLNKLLQEVLNPPKTGRAEKKFGERIFRSGDKIMQIKNNYQMKWKTDDDQRGEGVFNGDIGFIEGMNLADQKVVVRFDDGRTVHYDFSQLDEIIHAYAVTVHKSQGSEFPVLVMPVWSGPPMLMNRNILYTAVTRAKQLVVLVGDRRYLNIMVNNENQHERLSGLKFRLEGIVKEEFIV